MKTIAILLLSLLSFAVSAERRIEPPSAADNMSGQAAATVDTEALELFGSHIRVSRDGTGVVTNVSCKVCTSSTLKITTRSQAFVQGKKTGMTEAKRQAGNRVAYIRFNVKTNEVISIHW